MRKWGAGVVINLNQVWANDREQGLTEQEVKKKKYVKKATEGYFAKKKKKIHLQLNCFKPRMQQINQLEDNKIRGSV